MTSPVKLNEHTRKRKRINNQKSIFSTSQNIIFRVRDKGAVPLVKPPYKFSEKDENSLQSVLEKLLETKALIDQ